MKSARLGLGALILAAALSFGSMGIARAADCPAVQDDAKAKIEAAQTAGKDAAVIDKANDLLKQSEDAAAAGDDAKCVDLANQAIAAVTE